MLYRMANAISRCPELRVDGDALIDAIFCEFHIFNNRPKGYVRRDHEWIDSSAMRCGPELGLTFEKGILGGLPPL
jgi:hypothetical protein